MTSLYDAVQKLEHSMDYHVSRHRILSGNLANLDTPEFQPVDLHFQKIDERAPELALTATHAGHVTNPPAGGNTRFEPFLDRSEGRDAGLDGNSVSLERELAKINANRVKYGVQSELVSRRLALLKYAATDGT